MPFFKHILSFLLLQLVLFTAHGRINTPDHIGHEMSIRQKTGYKQEHGIILVKGTRDQLMAHHHSSGGPGHTCSKHSLPAYTQALAPLWLHSCTKSFISSVFARLLEYYTFHQLQALFPKHWFW